MKTQIINLIKNHSVEFENDKFDYETKFKNFDINVHCSPTDLYIEYDIYNYKTEEIIEFTDEEETDIINHFLDLLNEHYTSMMYLRDQLHHEEYLYNNR